MRASRDMNTTPSELTTPLPERKRVEEDVALFKTLINQSNDAILIVEPETSRILYVNDKVCSNLGYCRDELLAMRIIDIGANVQDMASWNDLVLRVKSNGFALFETEQRRKNGTSVPVEINVRFIAHNGAEYMVSVARDITERRGLIDQLVHAQKMEAIGQLAGGVAHDFNNLLTAIIGYGDLIQMKLNEDDPLQTDVDRILAAAERGAHLTQSLLAFSKKQIIRIRPMNVNDIVLGIEDLLLRLINEDIELHTALVPEELVVMADTRQMEQVLMNLATNARDAMPRGGRLTIKTDRAVVGDEFIRLHGYGRHGVYAVISVADTGAGMDKKTISSIFEPFFTTKEVGKGTGLGLSIVYGVVKQHNGYVTVRSQPDQGTNFTIYLPICAGEAETPLADAPAQALARGTETVLVAEDNADVRDLTRITLEKFGYAVITAADGEDAVGKFREHQDRIALLVLDVVMPRKNGRDAYDEILAIRPGTKALFISGHASDILTKEGIPENLNFVAKPFSTEKLLSRVREVLDKS